MRYKIILLLVLVLTFPAFATTWTVKSSGGDYTSLSSAYNNASTVDGDVIEIYLTSDSCPQLTAANSANKSVTIKAASGVTVTLSQVSSSCVTTVLNAQYGTGTITFEGITFNGASCAWGIIQPCGSKNLTFIDCIFNPVVGGHYIVFTDTSNDANTANRVLTFDRCTSTAMSGTCRSAFNVVNGSLYVDGGAWDSSASGGDYSCLQYGSTAGQNWAGTVDINNATLTGYAGCIGISPAGVAPKLKVWNSTLHWLADMSTGSIDGDGIYLAGNIVHVDIDGCTINGPTPILANMTAIQATALTGDSNCLRIVGNIANQVNKLFTTQSTGRIGYVMCNKNTANLPDGNYAQTAISIGDSASHTREEAIAAYGGGEIIGNNINYTAGSNDVNQTAIVLGADSFSFDIADNNIPRGGKGILNYGYNHTIRGNVIITDSPIYIWGGQYSRVFDNTVDCTTHGNALVLRATATNKPIFSRIYNNIIYPDASLGAVRAVKFWEDVCDTTHIYHYNTYMDYNIYYNGTEAEMFDWEGTGATTTATTIAALQNQWQQGPGSTPFADTDYIGIAGNDLHSIKGIPQFRDYGSDYSLLPSSPCINAGQPTLNGGKTTIGAWQPKRQNNGSPFRW